MAHHPEHSSPWILRADILEHNTDKVCTEPGLETDWKTVSKILRRLRPRSLTQESIDQRCSIFRSVSGKAGLSIWVPDLDQCGKVIPLYHPSVKSIVFEWDEEHVSIHFLPIKDDEEAIGRLRRLGSSLLKILLRYAKGCQENYVKKVDHDLLVGRDEYQDTYMSLKRKYSHIVSKWIENTDPQKHVWEDIGIATYLILLWKAMHRPQSEPFVDVGCGNGFLVFLLHQEGYHGYGFDLEERKSWQLWRDLCREEGLEESLLIKRGIDPTQDPNLPARCFLIGNHADELTPWIPLLASLASSCSGFLNIPCCFHKLDSRFTAAQYKPDLDTLAALPTNDRPAECVHLAIGRIDRAMSSQEKNTEQNVASQSTGPAKVVSRYGAYLAYILELTAKSGWVPELEALRIPSTKNWAIIGRRRVVLDSYSVAEGEVYWRNVVQSIVEKQSFVVRPKLAGAIKTIDESCAYRQ